MLEKKYTETHNGVGYSGSETPEQGEVRDTNMHTESGVPSPEVGTDTSLLNERDEKNGGDVVAHMQAGMTGETQQPLSSDTKTDLTNAASVLEALLEDSTKATNGDGAISEGFADAARNLAN